MPRLFDVHTHTQFAAYEKDSSEVIARALEAGIWLLNVGTQKETSAKAIEIAEGFKEGVYATVGLHPIHTEKSYHDPKELGEGEAAAGFVGRGETFDPEYYRKLGSDSKVVAIGECGLDYYRLREETKDKQKSAFEAQIQLALELKKPLMIHCRQAFADLIAILETNRKWLVSPYPGAIHFFTGGVDDARKLLNLGFGVSFGGVITFARDYDETLRFVPLQNILLETDAPYVAPTPYRGKRNEPLYILEVAKQVAELKRMTVEEVERVTTENAKRIFRI